jgi:hypothetical protein
MLYDRIYVSICHFFFMQNTRIVMYAIVLGRRSGISDSFRGLSLAGVVSIFLQVMGDRQDRCVD